MRVAAQWELPPLPEVRTYELLLPLGAVGATEFGDDGNVPLIC